MVDRINRIYINLTQDPEEPEQPQSVFEKGLLHRTVLFCLSSGKAKQSKLSCKSCLKNFIGQKIDINIVL
jgi:hypothetical protein